MNESTLVPREEMSDLDWLARNLHVWPDSAIYGVNLGGNAAFSNAMAPLTLGESFTKKQWLTRRAELQKKPSWKDAPKWANWLGQVDSGEWEWYGDDVKFPPTAGDLYWHHDGQGFPVIGSGEVLGDWRDTLEKRPDTNEMPVHSNQQKPSTDIPECAEVKQFDPFVSVEDEEVVYYGAAADAAKEYLAKCAERAATAKQPAITPSKYTKTIHGVSVDVYDVLQAWGVSNPALQHLIKKALQCGQRGHKDNAQDLQDIIDSAIRAKELEC